jgi:hypothetical protein
MTDFGIDAAADSASIWLNGLRDEGSRTVDQKKLEKAEEKIKQKQEKRQTDGIRPPPSLIGQECQASAAQVEKICIFKYLFCMFKTMKRATTLLNTITGNFKERKQA